MSCESLLTAMRSTPSRSSPSRSRKRSCSTSPRTARRQRFAAAPLHVAGERHPRGGAHLRAASNGAIVHARRGVDTDVLPLLAARAGRQGGEIGLGKVAQHLPVERPDEQKREIAEVGEPVGIHLHGAFQIEFLQQLRVNGRARKWLWLSALRSVSENAAFGACFTLPRLRAQL